MSKAPIFAKMERTKKVAAIIRGCLAPYGLQSEVDESKLHVRESFVSEALDNDSRLSKAILSAIFPHEPVPCTLYHYTSLEGLKSIASSGALRLYPIRKRLDQLGGELKTFAKAHRLNGYLEEGSGEPFIAELADDLFYTSMTRIPPKDADLMWGYFARGTGVRLEIGVRPKAAELRPIRYHQSGSVTLLQEINDSLAAAGLPMFLPWTLSRIGAFSLPSAVSSEDEVRLLVKRFPGKFDHTANDGTWDYWPVEFGVENKICGLDLKGIHVAPSGAKREVELAIAGTVFAGTVVTDT